MATTLSDEITWVAVIATLRICAYYPALLSIQDDESMSVDELLQQLRSEPDSIEFDQVMAVIAQHYDYTASGFSNGDLANPARSNEGSCKIFAFAQLNNLSEMETLALFGRYYREDVLVHPAAEDHANIRNFLLDGWLGIRFDGQALSLRAP